MDIYGRVVYFRTIEQEPPVFRCGALVTSNVHFRNEGKRE